MPRRPACKAAPLHLAKRIVVCGPRKWGRPFVVFLVVAGLKNHYGDDITILHGDAVGVDRMAGAAAKKLGLAVERYPADWKTYGRRAGLFRNRHMLVQDVDLVVGIGNGRGTHDCLFAACEANIPNIWRYDYLFN